MEIWIPSTVAGEGGSKSRMRGDMEIWIPSTLGGEGGSKSRMRGDMGMKGSEKSIKIRLNQRARDLRARLTDAENRMWYFLRARRLQGHKFTRQVIIEPYIVDFICRDKRLIIELDGGQHLDAMIYDQERTQYLEAQDYQVLRFWNHEVMNQIDQVLLRILEILG